jgi:peptide/nickel transport system permease protein
MPLFLLKRLLTLIATLLAASVVVFWVLEILPGNAAQILMGPDASPEAVQALARQLGLDHPPLQRYGSWIAGMLTGNLGNSYVYSTPVLELVLERLTLTVPLAVMAMAMTTVLALAVGVYAASHHNRAGDVGLMAATQVGVAIPNFWFAILLILLFAVHLRWFAAGGFPGWEDEGVLGGVKALASCRRLSLAVVQARHPGADHPFRGSRSLERGLRTYGTGQRAARASVSLWGHVLRNALIPVVTVMGSAVCQLARRNHRGRERVLPARTRTPYFSVHLRIATLLWCATASCCLLQW